MTVTVCDKIVHWVTLHFRQNLDVKNKVASLPPAMENLPNRTHLRCYGDLQCGISKDALVAIVVSCCDVFAEQRLLQHPCTPRRLGVPPLHMYCMGFDIAGILDPNTHNGRGFIPNMGL